MGRGNLWDSACPANATKASISLTLIRSLWTSSPPRRPLGRRGQRAGRLTPARLRRILPLAIAVPSSFSLRASSNQPGCQPGGSLGSLIDIDAANRKFGWPGQVIRHGTMGCTNHPAGQPPQRGSLRHRDAPSRGPPDKQSRIDLPDRVRLGELADVPVFGAAAPAGHGFDRAVFSKSTRLVPGGPGHAAGRHQVSLRSVTELGKSTPCADSGEP